MENIKNIILQYITKCHWVNVFFKCPYKNISTVGPPFLQSFISSTSSANPIFRLRHILTSVYTNLPSRHNLVAVFTPSRPKFFAEARTAAEDKSGLIWRQKHAPAASDICVRRPQGNRRVGLRRNGGCRKLYGGSGFLTSFVVKF